MKNITISLSAGLVFLCIGTAFGVTVRDTTFKDVGGKENTGWVIDTKTAKWLFEAGKERSGFGGLWSNDGKDWLQCYSGPGTAKNRGFPNSMGNFGHANRASGATNTIRDDKRSGDPIIIDAENKDLHFAYHIFEDHLALEVVKANIGYHFLYEATAGGSIYAKYWSADGKENEVTPDKIAPDLTPEWIYIGDKDEVCKYRLLAVKTPEDDFPNEHWQQGSNMAGFSWGRWGRDKKWKGGFLEGLDHKISLAMIPAATPHEEVVKMAETLSADHLSPMIKPNSITTMNNSMFNVGPAIISLGSAKYRISVPSSIKKFDIVNTRGMVVGRFQNTGAQTIIWNGSGITSGAYWLRAVSGTGTFTTPFISIVH